MKRFLTVTAAPLILMSAAIQPVLGHEPADTDAIIATLRALEQAQNDAANNKSGDGGLITSDDVMIVMPEGPPSRGVRPEMTATLNDPTFYIATRPGEAWVSESGDLAVTIAAVEFSMTLPDGTPVAQTGTRQFVWEKDEGGEWKVVTIFNGGTVPVALAPDGEPFVGSYTIDPGQAEGAMLWTVNDDRTFTLRMDDGGQAAGTWAMNGGDICLTPSDSQGSTCFTSSAVAGDSWVSTGPAGNSAIIRRQAAN